MLDLCYTACECTRIFVISRFCSGDAFRSSYVLPTCKCAKRLGDVDDSLAFDGMSQSVKCWGESFNNSRSGLVGGQTNTVKIILYHTYLCPVWWWGLNGHSTSPLYFGSYIRSTSSFRVKIFQPLGHDRGAVETVYRAVSTRI